MMAPSEPQLSTTIWCQSRLPAVGKPQRGKGVSRQYFQASRRSMNNQIKHNSGPSQQTAPSEHTLAKIPTLNGHSCTRSSRWSPSALASWIILLLSIIGLSQEANLFAQAFKSCPTAQSRAFESEFGTIARRIGTTLSARKKNGGRKVPKMPTLPVSTSPPSSSIATQGNESGDEDSFYSAPKTTTVCTMVVMDVENVRGATSFRISHEALLSRIRLWREDRLSMASSASSGGGVASLEPLIWICDHGTPSIHHFSPLDDSVTDDVEMPHNFGAVFAGGRTADDVIVDLVEARCGGEYYDCDRQSPMPSPSSQTLNSLRNSTIVITADARLISRCQQARRKSNSLSDVIFVEPASLLQQLERYRINSNEEESLFGVSAPSLQISPTMSGNIKTLDGKGRRSDGKTSTMTSFKESTIAMQQHAKFQARFQNKKGTKKTKEDSTNHAKGENERVYEDEEEDEDEDDSQSQSDRADSNSAALAAQLKTEQIRRQLLLSDAYYLARPSKNVRGRRAHTTVAAVHANYKNRNISKKQQKKLYEKRFGRKRKEDMVQAATKRKELAAKLHSNLKRLNTNSYDEIDLNCDKEGEDMMLIGSKRLLEKLLGKFEEERLDRINPNDQTVELTVQTTDHATMLGFDGAAGTVGSDDRWDPLGRTVNVPLRKHARDDKARLQPLRLVVISDTHGFEGGLSRFEDSAALSEDSSPPGEHHSKIHSDEFLLPQADILLHCGDFAASGSRKTQRAAARRLDEFLARQTHIPEKIVVQGNHDPDSPAKVLFPNSKALYVRSSSTLIVNGLSFALEPYSRRMAYRNIGRRTTSYSPIPPLPNCDVLVSHEPPKGVLDLTYHGFSAGSLFLREMVDRAEYKPRLWLCGHIHESRGLIAKQFQRAREENGNEKSNENDASTTVINASNANSGRANRIVSGAIVVEVERATNSGGGETAESTLRPSKTNYFEGIFDSTNGNINGAPLPGLGEDLELYVTRPGVRRRKGIPQSVRQQMKNVRSTPISNGQDA